MSFYVFGAGLAAGAILLSIAGVIYSRHAYPQYVHAFIWGSVGYVVFGVGLAAGYWAYVVTPAKARTDSPKATVNMGNTLDTKAPFETRFILTNNSGESFYNVRYRCEAFAPPRGGGVTIASMDITVFPELRPDGQMSLHCDLGSQFIIFGLDKAPMVILQIWVTFTYRSVEQMMGFRFWTKRAADGSYSWYPAGGAET